MRILVTGGAGFIGSAVVRHAIAAGHGVVNLDSLVAQPRTWRQELRRWNRLRRGKLTHLLWELEAVKGPAR